VRPPTLGPLPVPSLHLSGFTVDPEPTQGGSPVSDLTGPVLLGLLVWKLLDFVKYLRAGDRNGIITQLSAFVIGVVAVLVVAQSDFAEQVQVGAFRLSTLGLASQIVVGLVVSSLAGVGVDVVKSIDGTQSAAKPTLVGGTEVVKPAKQKRLRE
jgi:Na+/proline symporter